MRLGRPPDQKHTLMNEQIDGQADRVWHECKRIEPVSPLQLTCAFSSSLQNVISRLFAAAFYSNSRWSFVVCKLRVFRYSSLDKKYNENVLFSLLWATLRRWSASERDDHGMRREFMWKNQSWEFISFLLIVVSSSQCSNYGSNSSHFAINGHSIYF